MPIWVFREKSDFKKAFILLIIPTVVTMIIIVIRHAILKFDFRAIEKAIGGIYYNHVDYSTVLSMLFPLLCVAYPLTKGKTRLLRILLVITIIFFLPVIYVTYARAAMIALVFAAIVYVAIKFRLVNLIMPVFYALILMLVTYMVRDNKYIDFRPDYQHTYMHKSFTDHMIATFRGQDMSSMERL
jgi:hypothetical protein